MDAMCLHSIIVVHYQVSVPSEVRARKLKLLKTNKDGKQVQRNMDQEELNRRESQPDMKDDKNYQSSKEEELKIQRFDEEEKEYPGMNGDIEAKNSEEIWQGELGTIVMTGVQVVLAEGLDTNIAGDLDTNAVEVRLDPEALGELDLKIEEVLDTNVAGIREDLEMVENRPRELGNENDQGTKPSIPRHEEDASEQVGVEEALGNSLTTGEDTQTEATKQLLTALQNTPEKPVYSNLVSPRKQRLTRRASTPNVLDTSSQADSASRTVCERTLSLTCIHEISHGDHAISGFPGRERIQHRSVSSPEMLYNATAQPELTADQPKLNSEHRLSLTGIKKPVQNDAKSGLPPRERIRTRRASSPNLLCTTNQTEPCKLKCSSGLISALPTSALPSRTRTRRASSPNLFFTTNPTELTASKPKHSSEHKSSLMSIKEVNQSDATSALPSRTRTRRASSPNLLCTTNPTEFTAGKPTHSLMSIKELNQSDGLPAQEPLRRRRASSPSVLFTREPSQPTASTPRFSSERKPYLMSIQKLDKTLLKNHPPSEKPFTRARAARRSSIAVMTGVSNSGFQAPNQTPRSLLELNNCSQTFEKSDFKRKDSVQENAVHESLRKISTRLVTPLTGAQLEKRLLNHRVPAISAVLPTTLASTPDTKSPSQLDMSDLEECRYIRRRTYSK